MRHPAIPAALVIIAFLLALSLSLSLPRHGLSPVTFQAAAVDDQGVGVLVPFTLSLRPGSGRILVDVGNAFYKQDVEDSLRRARAAAEKSLGMSLENYDLEVGVDGNHIVGGESAGGLFTVAIASLALGRPIRNDAAMSATVTEKGELGPVEGIDEKIAAAADAGKTTFVVSKDQLIRDEAALAAHVRIVRAATARDAIAAMLQ